MVFTLGRALRYKKVSHKDFQQVLKEKYNHSVAISTIATYCSKDSPSPRPCWKVILKCLREQYNIGYRNGRWQEVKADER